MIGIVLAGGASQRFAGAPKGLQLLNGVPMARRVADMLAKFCSHVVIEAPANAAYEALGLKLCHAQANHKGKGPLAGLAAGLAAAPPGERVAFAPCDMPLLTSEIYDALSKASEGAPGAYATTSAGVEPLVTILDVAMREILLSALNKDDLPRTHIVLDATGARAVHFIDARPFENVNTPEDLVRLSQSLRTA
jgi:molybdopterin-guanine dinucleotide biosynthesis protein A